MDSHLHVLQAGKGVLACNMKYLDQTAADLRAALQTCIDAEPEKSGSSSWLYVVNFNRASFLALNGRDVTKSDLDV